MHGFSRLVDDGLHGCTSAAERTKLCAKIHIHRGGKADVANVFLGEGGQLDVQPRHIHALARAQHAVVLHGSEHFISLNIIHLHIQHPVIEQDVAARLHIACERGVRDVDFPLRAEPVGVADYLHAVSRAIGNGLRARGGANLRSLGIQEDTYLPTDRTGVLDDFTHACFVGMRRVDTDVFMPAS